MSSFRPGADGSLWSLGQPGKEGECKSGSNGAAARAVSARVFVAGEDGALPALYAIARRGCGDAVAFGCLRGSIFLWEGCSAAPPPACPPTPWRRWRTAAPPPHRQRSAQLLVQ
eukprot:1635203-Pleurochrysis_carterae.AAC.2